jgi:Flp pilus assembly protein TadG
MTTLTHKIFSRLQRQRGQAMVEFVIVLPILVMLVLGICQFGLAFHNYLSITDATRVGARAAAVKRTADPCDAAKAAIQATAPKQWDEISSIDCWTPNPTDPKVGEPFKVTVKYPYKIGLPGFSTSGELTASAEERLE